MNQSFKRHFALPSEIVYLNASYVGPMPVVASLAGQQAAEKRATHFYELTPSDFFESPEKLRATVATLWGTLPRNIALVPSVSYGVETAVKNISLKPGDEILVPQDDFPSNVYPWMEAAKRVGAQVRVAPRPADADWTLSVLEAMNERTAVASVPLCDWSDGTKFDLKTISQACRACGARFIVDVSQSFGAVPMAIGDFDPDYLFSVGYKWQMGPYGLSYMYVSDRCLDGAPLENAWLNRRGSEDFSRLIEYRDEYQDGARRFDSGQRSQFQLVPMALETMRFLREISLPTIYGHVSDLASELHDNLVAMGFQLAPLDRHAGHMLGARHRNWPDMTSLVKRLKDRGVFVSARGSCLRASPHLYNDALDIHRFIEALAREMSPKPFQRQASPTC